jgi:ribosome recycling factor
MEQALEHLSHELSGVRTGRANPGLLENITVHISGSSLPLKAVGAVTVRSSQLLAVSVYSPEVRVGVGCVEALCVGG